MPLTRTENTLTHSDLAHALALAIEPDPFDDPSCEAQALAREILDLVHDRGVGDIGDIRAALKRLAVHFPRTRSEVTR